MLTLIFISYFIISFIFILFLIPGVAGTSRNSVGDGPMERRGNKSQVHNDVNKRKRRRKPGGKRKPGRMKIYGSAYNQLRSDVGYIMSLLNTETKYIDSAFSVNFSGSWQIQLLNGISLGTSSTTRTGQSVKASGLEAKFFVTLNPLSTSIQSYRIVILQDKQPNATAVTPTDVYLASPVSPRTVAYLDRFTILWEKWAIIEPDWPTGEIEQFSRSLNFHVEFNTGNAGTIADITKNSVYMMWYSDAGANFGTLVYYTRFVFIDN